MSSMKDPLFYLHYKTVKLMTTFPFGKQLLAAVFFFHMSIILVEIGHFLYAFDSELLAQYGPFLFQQSYILANMVICLTNHELVKEIIENRLDKMSHFYFSDSKMAESVKSESKKMNILTIASDIASVAFGMLYWPIAGADDRSYYGIKIFREKLPTIELFLSLVYYSSFPFGTYMSTACAHTVIYLAMHAKFQAYYINDILINFDSLDQRKVFQKLKICIRHQTNMKDIDINLTVPIPKPKSYNALGPDLIITRLRLLKEVNAFMYLPLVLIILTASASLISLLYVINVEGANVHCCIFLTLGGFNGYLIFSCGQFFEDECLKMRENLMYTPWPEWSIENRRILLIIMTTSQNTPFFGNSGIFVYNFEHALKMGKFIYTATTFFLQASKM